ncbi:MAG: hypothetical protein JNM43_02215 [Planctomycetaceae bacterium]|nr:hypothetical protein [Planctomycetaceae bacterium]
MQKTEHGGRNDRPSGRRLSVIVVSLMVMSAITTVNAQEFEAKGPREEQRLQPDQFRGAVQVSFGLKPVSMSFDLPWHFCSVAENGLKFAHFAAETYDPRDWNGQGADASFEPGMDKEGRFVRIWIEHKSEARVVVRIRYALNNSKYQIAHSDLKTDSPYNGGKGDWAEERFTIYPDATHVRHMTVHTGLAAMSQPFGFYREPPSVVHEFMESIVIGPAGHVPTDDMEREAVTLIRMFGRQPGAVYPNGESEDIAFAMPEGPPSDFGEFHDANVMVLNSKSKFRPFTVGLPYGVKVQPYGWEDDERFPFATWTGYEDQSIGYVSAIGHMVNWWHFRRTEKTIEQVYLHGMTDEQDPSAEILPLAWSWIVPSELQWPGAKLSPNDSAGRYGQFTYDQTQRAYVVPAEAIRNEKVVFSLDAIYDDEHLQGTMWIAKPAFVIPNWKHDAAVVLTVDGEKLKPGSDYRSGIETTSTGKNLVIWINRTIDLNSREEHRAEFTIEPRKSR